MIIQFQKKQILAAIVFSILLAGGVFAQTETGQNVVGSHSVIIQGFDNSALFNVDLDSFNMNFTIEKIEEDLDLYYITCTYSDIVRGTDAWSVQVSERVIKLSKKAVGDELDKYLVKELTQIREDKITELKKEKLLIEKMETRIQVEKYSGLIGKTLDIASGIFPGYESEKIVVLPPAVEQVETTSTSTSTTTPEDLGAVYEEYIEAHQEEVENLDIPASSTDEQIQLTLPVNEIDELATSTN